MPDYLNPDRYGPRRARPEDQFVYQCQLEHPANVPENHYRRRFDRPLSHRMYCRYHDRQVLGLQAELVCVQNPNRG